MTKTTNVEELEVKMEVYEFAFYNNYESFPKLRISEYKTVQEIYDKLHDALSGMDHPFYNDGSPLVDIIVLKQYAQKIINKKLPYDFKLTDLAVHCVTHFSSYYYIIEIDLEDTFPPGKTYYLPFFINYEH